MNALIFVCALFLFCTMVFEVFVVYFIYRVLLILERRNDAGQERSGTATSDYTSSGPSKVGSIQDEPKVGELPPEVIAPRLTKPPRPAGGFGSRVGESDGGTQLHKRNQDSHGRDESGSTTDERSDGSENSCSTEESGLADEAETLDQRVKERSKKAKPG